jgi:hypothetical protein
MIIRVPLTANRLLAAPITYTVYRYHHMQTCRTHQNEISVPVLSYFMCALYSSDQFLRHQINDNGNNPQQQ